MIRRLPIETKINHERWLVSWADFVTLLFAFFVVMYSVSQVSESKYKSLSETLSLAFDGAQLNGDVDTDSDKKPDSPLEENLAELSELQQELENALDGLVKQNRVSLSGNEDWVEIQINANMLFDSGQSDLSPDAESLFIDIARTLAPYDNAVEVSGHTDNVPIQNANFSNNWALSSARAVSVVDWLSFNGIQPQRLSAVGYGEHRPIADNTSDEGRASNRRVVLRVARERAEQPPQTTGELFGEAPPADLEIEISEPIVEEVLEDAIQPIQLENGGLLFTGGTSPRARAEAPSGQE